MALIATVNGKPIYSNKKMNGIVNGRITFTDGSWCDVNSGEVHNAGSGFIKIGGMDTNSETKKVTEGPKQVSASALELRGLTADVQVDVYSGTGIEYTITGPADDVKTIRANVQSNHTLVIEGGTSSNSMNNMTIIGGAVFSGNVSIGRSTFIANTIGGGSGNDANLTKVTVKVPLGTSINSNDVNGNVIVGATDGPLVVIASKSARVKVDRVTSAQLNANSSGRIEVNQVNGPVNAAADSSGRITVHSGNITSLMAAATSSGRVEVDGIADTAMLTASSSGRINVEHVRQQPTKSQSSSGRVQVRRIG